MKARGWTIHLATDHRVEAYGQDFPAQMIHIIPSATITKAPLEAARAILQLGKGVIAAGLIAAQATGSAATSVICREEHTHLVHDDGTVEEAAIAAKPKRRSRAKKPVLSEAEGPVLSEAEGAGSSEALETAPIGAAEPTPAAEANSEPAPPEPEAAEPAQPELAVAPEASNDTAPDAGGDPASPARRGWWQRTFG